VGGRQTNRHGSQWTEAELDSVSSWKKKGKKKKAAQAGSQKLKNSRLGGRQNISELKNKHPDFLEKKKKKKVQVGARPAAAQRHTAKWVRHGGCKPVKWGNGVKARHVINLGGTGGEKKDQSGTATLPSAQDAGKKS